MAKTKNKTYYTKADLMSFGEYLLSDRRRGKKQREAREKLEQGIQGIKPWSIMERILSEDDFKDWKNEQNN